ncbi:MAG: hypothetical protein KDB80_15990 [Planctomycetes bacterium]|nr:hypothetical protein [Planctomycetota bacterium]
MSRPAAEFAGPTTLELPSELDIPFERLPRPRGVDEAAMTADSAPLARRPGTLIVELDAPLDRDDLRVVVLDGESRRELARLPAASGPRLVVDDVPEGSHVVVLAPDEFTSYRSYLSRATVTVLAGREVRCELDATIASLTVTVPAAEQPVVLELVRPDDVAWSMMRRTEITRVDATQVIVFEPLGVASYLLVEHRPDAAASRSIPITVVSPTTIGLSDPLR